MNFSSLRLHRQGRALREDKDFFPGEAEAKSLCRATCNATSTLFCLHSATHDYHLCLDKFSMAWKAMESIIKEQLWQLWLCLQSRRWRQVRTKQVRGGDPRATPSKPKCPVLSRTSWRFLRSICKAECCQIMDARILSCIPLKRRRQREKDKNGTGDLQSWACCSCSHGRDPVWGKEGLSTGIRLALLLSFPASFVSPHGPALFLEPRVTFPAVEQQEPFPWRGVTLAGKECLLRVRWCHPEPHLEWAGKAVPSTANPSEHL